MDTMKVVLLVLVTFCYCFTSLETVPIPNSETEFEFEDHWNYAVQPHNLPVLDDSAGNSLIPPTYEYDQNLKIQDQDAKRTVKEIMESERTPKKIEDVLRTTVSCNLCKIGVGLLDAEIKNESPFEVIREKFVNLCVSFQIEIEPVCAGFFNVYGPEVIPAYNTSGIGPSGACKMIFGENCADDIDNKLQQWDLNVTGPSRTSRSSSTQENKDKFRNSLKVLQLSDVHYDPEYETGTPANCEEPLCCRSYSTPSTKEDTIYSGRWGAYQKCDSPKIIIENMLKHIALQHPDIDYILWTGDVVPHDIWNQTKESNLKIIQETVRQMVQYFPETPIFPAVGNHESVPAGNFAPPWMKEDNHSISWLYNELSNNWSRWLPSASGNTLLRGGFYSVLLRPGFRLITINTNYCHTLSWWLMVNNTDPAKQLKWLVYELEKAEENEEKVHIIGHIPPGSSDCLKTWSKHFYALVERYQDTITSQFYGHTHADEFEIFYDTKEYSTPINIAYLAPSVTTYENYNPAYRIYYVDGTTKEILDHETWTFDLEAANKNESEPVWYKLYSARDLYTMTSLKPSEWNNLVQRLVTDDNLFEEFYRIYYRESPTRPACDSKCKLQIICDLKTARSQDRKHLCQDLIYID